MQLRRQKDPSGPTRVLQYARSRGPCPPEVASGVTPCARNSSNSNMKHELSSVEKTILLAAVRDLQRLRRGKALEGMHRTDGWFRLQEAVQDAKRGLVKLDAARWLGEAPMGRTA